MLILYSIKRREKKSEKLYSLTNQFDRYLKDTSSCFSKHVHAANILKQMGKCDRDK